MGGNVPHAGCMRNWPRESPRTVRQEHKAQVQRVKRAQVVSVCSRTESQAHTNRRSRHPRVCTHTPHAFHALLGR